MKTIRPLLFVAATLVCLLPSAASAADSPANVLASILAAGHAQRSVHYTSTANLGTMHVTVVGDAGVEQGIQHVTFQQGGKTGHLTVIVSGKTAYLRGDAFTLTNYLHFKATPATNYAGRWVRYPHTDSDYAGVAEAVTLGSAVDELKMGGRVSLLPATKVNGQSVVGVRGQVTSAGHTTVDTVYGQASGSRLPVQQVATEGLSNLTTTFESWNVRVDVAAPKGSVAIAFVRAAGSAPVA